LNGYYLNLRGAFDNLAWALQFELGLFQSLVESSRNRGRIHLFGGAFVTELTNKAPRLAQRLEALKPWAEEVKGLRDPAAHRVPLYVIPGVIRSQEDLDDFHRIDALAGAPKDQLTGQSRSELMREARGRASYQPLMVVPRLPPDEPEIWSIPVQLIRDHRRYLSVSRSVIKTLRSAG
jgi:hypothetical protein